MIILRLKYKKEGNMKFLSHLELIKAIERVFRRMHLPMDFSKGFSPKPKINYAAPLPVGVSSECDYLDVELLEKIDINHFIKIHEKFMPRGLIFLEGKYYKSTKSLMSMVTDSAYEIELDTQSLYKIEDIKTWLNEFLALDTITYEKLNKKNKMIIVDIKPLIQEMEVLSVEANKMKFKVLVTTGSNGNLKPEKLMSMFVEMFKIDVLAFSEQYKRLALFTRDKENNLVTFFEV